MTGCQTAFRHICHIGHYSSYLTKPKKLICTPNLGQQKKECIPWDKNGPMQVQYSYHGHEWYYSGDTHWQTLADYAYKRMEDPSLPPFGFDNPSPKHVFILENTQIPREKLTANENDFDFFLLLSICFCTWL